MENSSQCSAAERSQPAPQESHLQGSEQVIGMLQPLMLGERRPGKTLLSVEVFLHSALIYTAQLKECSSQPVWMPIYIQRSMKIQCSMGLNLRQHSKIGHHIGGKSPCFFAFLFIFIKSRNLDIPFFSPQLIKPELKRRSIFYIKIAL